MRTLCLLFLLSLASTLAAQTQTEQPRGVAPGEGVSATPNAVASIGFVSLDRLRNKAKKQEEGDPEFIVRGNTAVLEVAKARGLQIVLQEAVYADPAIDITDEIASVMNGNVATLVPQSSSIETAPRLAFVDGPRVLQAARAKAWTQAGQIEAANKAVKDIALREGIVLVLQKAVYASRGIDLTPRVLEELER